MKKYEKTEAGTLFFIKLRPSPEPDLAPPPVVARDLRLT